MVSYYEYEDFRSDKLTYYHRVYAYQNKPKVIRLISAEAEEASNYQREDYINILVAMREKRYLLLLRKILSKYKNNQPHSPLVPWNTTPSTCEKTSYKVTPSETAYQTGEVVGYLHEGYFPGIYIGIYKEMIRKYDGTPSGAYSTFEKTTRTFTTYTVPIILCRRG
jgi:hypothetical protein